MRGTAQPAEMPAPCKKAQVYINLTGDLTIDVRSGKPETQNVLDIELRRSHAAAININMHAASAAEIAMLFPA